MRRVADTIAVIQATLAPSFLVSGASIFLNFTQTRLFRVVDRIRSLAGGTDGSRQVRVLQRRALVLRNAIFLGVATVACTVITAILVMAQEMFARPGVGMAAPYVFALAMLLLFAALCMVLYDTFISVRTVTHPESTAAATSKDG